MGDGELSQEALSAGGDSNSRGTAIRFRAGALHETALLEPSDQLDRGVVTDDEPLGDRTDRWIAVEPLQREEHLVLLRFETRVPRLLFGECDELAKAMAKLGERAIFTVGHRNIS